MSEGTPPYKLALSILMSSSRCRAGDLVFAGPVGAQPEAYVPSLQFYEEQAVVHIGKRAGEVISGPD
jgi:hypothetical protein